MSTSTSAITIEEFLALPDDGVERYILRGELIELRDPQGPGMTVRNRWHSRLQVKLSTLLEVWSQQGSTPQGQVFAGESGCVLRQEPMTLFGVDVAYFSAAVMSAMSSSSVYLQGPPVLAVEILSPSDVHENVVDKIREYLACGVAVVWIVDPDLQHITAYRPKRTPQQFTTDDELVGDPELPGLRFSVRDVFRD